MAIKELGAIRRLRETAAEEIQPSDFKVSEEEPGMFRVKVSATGGILVSAM